MSATKRWVSAFGLYPSYEDRPMRRPSRTKITVGTALRLTYRAFARDFARRLQPHGMTLLMWFVLRELWKRDGLSQNEIATATDRQASAIVTVLRTLQDAGLVKVSRSAKDGRRSVVRLTRAGRKLEPVLTAHGKNLSQTAQRGFTAAEKRSLMEMLARLRHNIESNGENGAFSGESLPRTRSGVVTGSPKKMRPNRK
jgi:DNA-binding MarR family transcriptional regulator